MADSSLARQSTPVAGARLDRTAAHAAVRNLAESYGVDLLPLDLSHMADLDAPTPVNVSIPRRCSEPEGPPHRQLSSVVELPTSPCAGGTAPPAAPEVAITPRQRCSPGEIVTTCSPRKAPAVPAGTDSDATTAAGIADRAAAAAADSDADAEQAWVDSSCVDALVADADEEGEYLEYDLPLEHRISLLEEERDILVDKLLATTEALHASEARNRQNQASASQVGALLNQLQELLRRAEVERDRAKLQLKRQRVSATQLTTEHSASAVVDRLAAAPFLAQSMSAPLQATAEEALGSSSTGEGSSDSIAAAASQPTVSEQLRHSKKHKSSSEDGILGQAAAALSGELLPASDEATAAAAGSSSSIGRRKRGSSSTADAAVLGVGVAPGDTPASPGAEQLESPVTLTPSSNEVRPPVKIVINGFEALLKQRARAAAAKAAAARAAAAEAAAAAAAAAAAPAGFVAAAVASREAEVESPSKAQAVAAAAGKDRRVRSLAAAMEPEAATAAAAAAAAELAAVAAAAEAAAAEAAARAAGADACAGLGMQVPHIRVDRVRSEDGCNCSAAAAGHPAGSSVGSEVSTPTAAAVCNASPARFRAELLSLDDGMSESEVITSSEVMDPSYAAVVCRSSRERSRASSRAASKSPSPSRPVQKPAASSSKDAGAGSSCQPLQESKATAAVAINPVANPIAGVMFNFGRSSDGGSNGSSSSKKGHGASPARSPKAAAGSPKGAFHSPRGAGGTAGTKAPNASRLGCAAVASSASAAAPKSVVAAAVAEAKMVKQKQRQGVVYNPKAFKAGDSSCSSSMTGMSTGNAVAPAPATVEVAAVRAAEPEVADVAHSKAPADAVAAATAGADAAFKPSSASVKGQQQQQSSKKTQPPCTAVKKQQQQQQGQQPKQVDQQQQQQQQQQLKPQSQPQPQLKVDVGIQTPAASPKTSGLGSPGSPADCTAEVVTCDSSHTSSSNTCGSGRGPHHKGKKQATSTAAKGKVALQASVAKGSAGKELAAATSSNAAHAPSQISVLLKVALVVVLLLSGGLFAALVLTRQGTPQQAGVAAAGSLDLQQQLEKMQDRVAELQWQLTERELQLATCASQDVFAADETQETMSDRLEF